MRSRIDRGVIAQEADDVELMSVQCRHMAMRWPCPLQRDHRHVAHEVEDRAGRGTLAGRRAIGQGCPPFCQALAYMPLHEGLDQQRDQVHTAERRHPRGRFQDDGRDGRRVLGPFTAQLHRRLPFLGLQQLGI
jgi:hypothetical protein